MNNEIINEEEEDDEQLCIHGVHDDSDIRCPECYPYTVEDYAADIDDMLYTRMKEDK